MQSPLHNALEKQGACFGEVGGFERPNWFARGGASAEYEYSYSRQNWFEFSAAEHRAVRESVGVYDISSFGKFEVSGAGALATLQRLSCADIAVESGRVVYTQWLNERGGIEADLTIARLAEDCFWVITGIGSYNRDWWRLKKHLLADTELKDISMDFACLSVQGPNAGEVLKKLAETDLSTAAFGFSTGKLTPIAKSMVWMQRISYVGELGWELFIPAADAPRLLEEIHQAGAEFELCNVGLHAVNSLRLEKGFRHWGHDVAAEDNLLQAGLSFTAKPDAGDFIGRDAHLAAKAAGLPERRMVQLVLEDPEPLLYHNEPIIMNGDVAGYLSSAMYGHTLGAACGMGYVNAPGLTADALASATFEIEVATTRVSARASLRPLYDPTGQRMRS
jgi:4-methylaminobutanoate oxidase (formaldehyde-forming)